MGGNSIQKSASVEAGLGLRVRKEGVMDIEKRLKKIDEKVRKARILLDEVEKELAEIESSKRRGMRRKYPSWGFWGLLSLRPR